MRMLEWILLVLGLCGVALSTYMTAIFVRVRRGEEVRCFDAVCPVVMNTGYARALGFPTSYLAIPYYCALTLTAGLRLAGRLEWMFLPVPIAASAAATMSAYLAYTLIVRLKHN